MYRSIRWLDRSMSAHKRPAEQALFGIVQGGLEPHLREICLKEMVQRDRLPGFAIGGLAGGEDKSCFWRVVELCTRPSARPVEVGRKRAFSTGGPSDQGEAGEAAGSKRPKLAAAAAAGAASAAEPGLSSEASATAAVRLEWPEQPDLQLQPRVGANGRRLDDEIDSQARLQPAFSEAPDHVGLPPNKPRYLMGVGVPVDLVVCVALGVDMFDCVYASRCARFGQAFVADSDDMLSVRRKQSRLEFIPVLEGCPCLCCRRYTRAAIHSMLHARSSKGAQLLTIHNITYLFELMRAMRAAIREQRLPEWVRGFMLQRFRRSPGYPRWAVEALASVGISLTPLEKPLQPDRNQPPPPEQ